MFLIVKKNLFRSWPTASEQRINMELKVSNGSFTLRVLLGVVRRVCVWQIKQTVKISCFNQFHQSPRRNAKKNLYMTFFHSRHTRKTDKHETKKNTNQAL